MTPAATIRAALSSTNVQAFLRVIRQGESHQGFQAYYVVNGASNLTSLDDHPYNGVPSPPGRASGAYQFLGTTWHRLASMYPADMPDFSPPSQDFAAVADIAGRGALQAVIDGDFDHAVELLRPEWTSLPGASQSSGWSMDRALQVYEQYGGTRSSAAAPAQIDPGAAQPAPQGPGSQVGAPSPGGGSMPALALLSLFAPFLSQLIPQIASLLKPQSEVAQRNTGLAELVLNTITTAAQAPNLQAAVEKMQADPKVAAAVKTAVVTEPAIMDTLEIGPGGIESARAANVPYRPLPNDTTAQIVVKTLFNPVLIVSVGLVPLIYLILWYLVPFFGKISADAITGILNTIIGLVLGGICGFWLGQVYQQHKPGTPAAGETIL